ncbi:MAG: NTP transferase domain-containing protein [Alphaproteobacteria bacterium]|jgi:mannose-1-phosphate guanylyltransferase/mannose-6-phosphate isomerase|nr:NTP transferase domain-containing protein [Alphaproteobacteria bacterium]
MTRIHPVIMAGGSGTRLWPVSRRHHPKQFQRMLGTRSMFQETVRRVQGSAGAHSFTEPSVIGGHAFGDLITGQLAEIGTEPARIVLEPFGRNTAAVAAIAAAIPEDEDGLVLLLPSDHFMSEPQAFREAVGAAADRASEGYVTTFGITAREPETGYGYIRQGAAMGGSVYHFDAFVEKPNLETAKSYVAEGRYTWNAGIFLFPAALMRAEMQAHAPDILTASLAALERGARHGPVTHLDVESFRACREDSIDYAVMEKTNKGAVYGPLECGWSDIGSWKAIADLADIPESGDVISLDNDGCYLRSDGDTLIAAVGLEDLIVIAHEGAVLVAPRTRAQDVKAIVNALKDANRGEWL